MWGGRRQEIGHKLLIYRSLSHDGANWSQYVYVTENHGLATVLVALGGNEYER